MYGVSIHGSVEVEYIRVSVKILHSYLDIFLSEIRFRVGVKIHEVFVCGRKW